MADITGTFHADFAPFEQAVKEAEITLKGFETGAEDVAKKLTRIGDSFSGVKVIQEAELMAEAIQRAGGISTLTATELARAAGIAAEAVEKLHATNKPVPENIQALADAETHAAKATDDLGVSFTKLVGSMISAEAIIGAVKAVWAGFTSEIAASITAAEQSEKVHVQLMAALQAQGSAVPSVVAAYNSYASALQATTIYSDDAIKAAETLLVLVGGVMPADMEKALAATTNLASGLGKDLPEAAALVAKAATGNTAALEKSGVALDATKVKAEGFGYVLDQISAKFDGQAAALAGTYEGRLQQLANTWDSLHAAIGRVITQNATVLGAIDAVNQMIAGNTGELNDNATANDLVSDAVIALTRALGLGLSAVSLLIEGYTNFRIAANLVGASLTTLGGYALDSIAAIMEVQKYYNPLAWTSFWKNAVASVKDSAAQLHGASEGFIADNAAAVTSGERWAGAASRAADGLNTLAAGLESTRGQIKGIYETVGTGDDGVWQRHTDMLKAQAAALAEYTKAWEKHAEDTAKIWDDAFIAQANIDQNSLAAHLAVIDQRRQADINEAARTIESADQLQDRIYAINAKYNALAVNETRKKNEQIAETNRQLADELETVIASSSESAYQKAIRAIDQWYVDLVAKHQQAGDDTAEFYDRLEKLDAAYRAKVEQDALKATEGTKENLEQKARDAEQRYQWALDHYDSFSDAMREKLRKDAEDARAKANAWGVGFEEAGKKASAAVDGVSTSVKKLTDTFVPLDEKAGHVFDGLGNKIEVVGHKLTPVNKMWDDASRSFVDVPSAMGAAWDAAKAKIDAAEAASNAVVRTLQLATVESNSFADSVATWFPQFTEGSAAARNFMASGMTAGEAAYAASGGIIHGPIGGLSTRASGGPVAAATPYLVGENGPEIFMPAVAGNILPNGAKGAGVVIHAPIYVNGTAADVARQVAAELLRTIKAGAQLAGA